MNQKLAIYCDCDSDSGMLTYTLMLLAALRAYSDVETLVISSTPRNEVERARLDKLEHSATELKIIDRNLSATSAAVKISKFLTNRKANFYIPNYRYMPHLVLSYLPRGIKNIVIVHNDTSEIYDAIKFYSPAIDGVIFPSKSAFQKSHQIIPSSSKVWIPHYFTVLGEARKEIESSRLIVVYHGRLAHSQKKSLELINIAQQLNKLEIPFTLKLIGSGDALDSIQKKIKDDAIENVEVLGQVSREQLINHLRSAHIALSTSVYEGFCYSIAESLGLGIIPVVYENDVLHDLIQDGINGYLVPWGRADMVAQKIQTLYRDKQNMRVMSEAAIKSVRPLISPERYANQMTTFFNELASRPIGKPWPRFRPRGLAYDSFSSRFIARLGKKLRLW